MLCPGRKIRTSGDVRQLLRNADIRYNANTADGVGRGPRAVVRGAMENTAETEPGQDVKNSSRFPISDRARLGELQARAEEHEKAIVFLTVISN